MDLTKVDSIKKRAFLAAFSECGNITKAAEMAGCSRCTHHKWLSESHEYPELFEQAKESASDKLEQEARRRAVEGTKEAIYYQGEIVGHKMIYSDNLLMFLLKGERPEKFKDRTELTGAKGGPIQLEAMTSEERKSRIAELMQKMNE